MPVDNVNNVDNLKTFFEPKGVALVGARHSGGFGYGIPMVLKRQGWGERLYLVNPSGGELHGLPVYKNLADVPDPVDLAVVIVPAPAVPGVLEEIARRGIRHTVVESAGFAEVGEAGRSLQDGARRVAREHGMRVIGPNCVGVVNSANRFSTVEIADEAFTPGSTSIIAQSGVFGNVLLDMLPEYELFVAKAATLGNRMDVDECDMLEYLGDDEATRIIMMYLEGTADGHRLRRVLESVSAKKPVLVLKTGRTEAGKAATASHTASLSGTDSLYDAVFDQTGVVRAQNLEELVETARVFATQPLPKGPRLGIVTSSGSLGAMATDAAVSKGLVLPPLSEGAVSEMRDAAPDWMNVKNPLDVGPSPLFQKAMTTMLEDPDVDMVIAVAIIPYVIFKELTRRGYQAEAWFGDFSAIHEAVPEKPFVVCAVGHSEFVRAMRKLAGTKVPVFVSPEPAARALGALYNYSNWKAGRGHVHGE
jgi:acyl-CoA synthetase (NDP forming)